MLNSLQTLYDAGLSKNALVQLVKDLSRTVDPCLYRDFVLYAWLLESEFLEPRDVQDNYSDTDYCVGCREYAVLNECDANIAAADAISSGLWAIEAGWLATACDLPAEVFQVLQEKFEDGNDAVYRIVDAVVGIDKIVERYLRDFGRAELLAHYDGKEHVVEYGELIFYIYRTG